MRRSWNCTIFILESRQDEDYIHPLSETLGILRRESGLECIELSSNKVRWNIDIGDSRTWEMSSPKYLLIFIRNEPNNGLGVVSLDRGKLFNQHPHSLDRPPKYHEYFKPAAMNDDQIILWRSVSQYDEHIFSEDHHYHKRAHAYSLPDFKPLWEGEHEFHQTGYRCDVGGPYEGVLTRDFFWYVWRTYTSKNPKTYLTALNRSDGRIAYKMTVGPWVEQMLAVNNTLVIVGRGGTVSCFEEK